MSISPKIGQLVITPDGVAAARIKMEHIAVVPSEDGSKIINVQDGDHVVIFRMDREQCRHLAALLLGAQA